MMRVGSLFSGIGGFDLAAENVGLKVAWQIENEKNASKVLAHHWPHLTNHGDIHGFSLRNRRYSEILVGGFPCQSYSVAGDRGGLAEDRGALWWEFHRLIGEGKPAWVVGENVPGLLSSAGGRDFATIIRSLVQLGYGVVWRVLDAQWFGVAQRRRRVFIVGHSGGQPRPEILALAQGLSGDTPPSREKGTPVAALTRSSVGGGGGPDDNTAQAGHLVATQNPIVNHDQAHALSANAQQAVVSPQVRRLTPLECERLQGFPDYWTDTNQSDTQRYRQLGNAVAVPVAQWIFDRIVRFEKGQF